MATVFPEQRVNDFFEGEVAAFQAELIELAGATAQQRPQYNELLARLAQAITRQSRACLWLEQQIDDTAAVKELQTRFQGAIQPWFSQSWFMERAQRKPRGYPGDYVLLDGIYDKRPKSLGLGGYLDLYFLESDLGRAVRARMSSARQFLNREIASRGKEVRIMNVASGPCREYFVGLDYPFDRNVSITCIDSDAEALEAARRRWASATYQQTKIDFVNYNALRMRSAKQNLRRFGPQDIIYSVGLFDYIPDKYLVPVLQGLRQTLAPGGVLFVAFKDQGRYDKAEYQWFVDWFFYQRSEQDCRSLLRQAGFTGASVSIERDYTGIIMNFRAAVPEAAAKFSRVDRHSLADHTPWVIQWTQLPREP